MEEYFEKYAKEFEATEVESPVSEADFMRYYTTRHRKRLLYYVASAAAAAAVIAGVMVFAFTNVGRPAPDAVAVYIQEYTDGIEPIYNDVVSMEQRSELSSVLNLSSVMKDIMNSIPELNEDLKGVDQGTRMEAVRQYCEEQAERISHLYSECLTSYAID